MGKNLTEAELIHPDILLACNDLRYLFEVGGVDINKIKVVIADSEWRFFQDIILSRVPSFGRHDEYQVAGIRFVRDSAQ